MEGFWNEEVIKMFTLSLKICIRTLNSNYKSEEEIKEYFRVNKLNLNFNYLIRVNFEKHQIPIKYSFLNVYFYLSTLIKKRIYFKFENHKLITDNVFFTPI